MSLVDIVDTIFKFIGKTAIRSLIIATLILLPPSILLTYGMDSFFSTIATLPLAEETDEVMAYEDILSMSGAMAIYFVSSVLFAMASLAAALGVTIIGCSQMSDQRLHWREVLKRTFSVRLLRVYGQLFLEYLALASLFLIPVAVIAAGLAGESIAVVLIGGSLYLAAIGFVVYFWVRWAFALPAIAWEDAGIIKSFRRSLSLVKGSWWRTFGILALLFLMAQLAISIITTPIGLAANWSYYSKYFSMFESIAGEAQNSQAVTELFGSLGIGTGIMTFISSVASLVVIPLIITVMYFDLRARKHEFVEPSETMD